MNCVRIPGSPEHPPIGGGIPDENRIADETRISDATRISDTTCISDATRQSATARTASAYPVTVPLHMPEAGRNQPRPMPMPMPTPMPILCWAQSPPPTAAHMPVLMATAICRPLQHRKTSRRSDGYSPNFRNA